MKQPAAEISSGDLDIDPRVITGRDNSLASHLVAVGILVVISISLFVTSPTNGDFWWFDSSRHAMNGVFLRDFLMDGGWLHPLEYAGNYYRKYPAINIGFYPPFLYISSVPFLVIFGISHGVVQGVVSLYALAAGVCTYSICCLKTDKLTAVAAAVVVMTVPDVALWSRQVQIDVPAIALVLATALLLIRHLQTGNVLALFGTVVCLGLALLTRLQTAYAAPVVLAFLFLYRYPNRPALRIRIAAVAVLCALALPSVLIFIHFSGVNKTLATAVPWMPRLLSIENWTWYLKKLPHQLGLPAMILAAGGVVAGALSIKKNGLSMPMLVIACFGLASWTTFTVISNKEQRFNLPSVPFILIFASIGLHQFHPRLAKIAITLVALFCATQAIVFEKVPTVAGFNEAAKSAAENAPPNSNVLISAHRDGSFIFDLRALGSRPDVEVRRGDKLFVEMTIMRQLGIRDRQLDKQAILDILDREKIATIVAQRDYLIDQPSMRTFQDLLESRAYFVPIDHIAMSGDLMADERELVVYKKK